MEPLQLWLLQHRRRQQSFDLIASFSKLFFKSSMMWTSFRLYINYFSSLCNKISHQTKERVKKRHSPPYQRRYGDGNRRWLVSWCSQSGNREWTGSETELQKSRLIPSDPLLQVRLHLLMFQNLWKQFHQLGTKCVEAHKPRGDISHSNHSS